MQRSLSTLEKLITHLPEIKQKLGKHWPDFASRMGKKATLFEDLSDERALMKSVNQLYGLFMQDETACEILTRPRQDSGETAKAPNPSAKPEVELQTIANHFYLLCEKADEFIEQGELAQLSVQTEPEGNDAHD